MLANTPLFLVKFSCFSSCTLLFLQSCVSLKTLWKIVFFSRAQLLGITDSKAPFQAPSQNGTFATKVPFGVFPCACWNPYCCSVWWLWMGTKKDIFQKQIVATKMRVFCTFWTQIVLAYFSKKCHFNKKEPFSSRPPKNTIFCFFWKFPFPLFSSILFWFIQHKKDKNLKPICFSERNPDTLPKNIFAPLHTICVFKTPSRHYKFGENKHKKILDWFSAQPWTDFQLKKR